MAHRRTAIPCLFRAALVAASIGLSVPARSQSFNVDLGSNTTYPVPAATFAGAAGQAGVWNAVSAPATAAPLVDVAGAATSVVLSSAGGSGNFQFNNAGTSGDDQSLMDDVHNVGGTGGTTTWTVQNLAAGSYLVTTYAWAPDNATYVSRTSVLGSIDPSQDTYGAWPGGYVHGRTHARHRVTVTAGGSIAITVSTVTGFASVNGFQVSPLPAGAYDLCQPGADAAGCPCSNPAATSPRGCNNSDNTGGARLSSAGAASVSADTLAFTTSGEKATATSIVLQGDARIVAGTLFGQGIRCTGGTLLRLYLKAASGGSITAPQAGDPSVSARSAALGSPLAAGVMRWYSVYYRDPTVLGGCPALNTFNTTQAQELTWGP